MTKIIRMYEDWFETIVRDELMLALQMEETDMWEDSAELRRALAIVYNYYSTPDMHVPVPSLEEGS